MLQDGNNAFVKEEDFEEENDGGITPGVVNAEVEAVASGDGAAATNDLRQGLKRAKRSRMQSYPGAAKNLRKSRTGTRGLPKKGGAGGKGVWGAPGSELVGAVDVLDEQDPNYDSDSGDNVRVIGLSVGLSTEAFEAAVSAIVREFFEHGTSREAAAALRELDLSAEQREKVVSLAVTLSLQRKNLQRELTSQLLSGICGSVLSREELSNGFDILLAEVEDLTVDVPEAPEHVGKFIARAVADDLLPPKFVTTYKGRVKAEASHAVKALAKAENLLTMRHSEYCLSSVWGVPGGTKQLVKKVKILLEEYLSSDDVDEASRCLRELDAPHFHHEMVYQAVLLIVERAHPVSSNRLTSLLRTLAMSAILTPEQLTAGLRRVYAEMAELVLDVPQAYLLLERFVDGAADFLPAEIATEAPRQQRRRFVSEGDRCLARPPAAQHPW